MLESEVMLLCELLGLSRMEIDGFLKERGVYLNYTIEELEQDSGVYPASLKLIQADGGKP